MIEQIAQKDIQIMVPASDWKDAIRKSALPLVESGTIENRYVEEMIASAIKNGPYFVITKGIALAHARPECGVHNFAVGITTLQKGVKFGAGENDPVWMIIVLAATDDNSHIDLLGELADKLMDAQLIDRLHKCRTPAEFRNLLLQGSA